MNAEILIVDDNVDIRNIINELILDAYEVPYFTRIWFSQVSCDAK